MTGISLTCLWSHFSATPSYPWLSSRVPHRSTLLLHYTDEIPEIAEHHGVSADGTELYLSFSLHQRDANNAVLQLEDCVGDIRKWTSLDKLKLNEDRKELLVILPSHQAHTCSITSISIGGSEVQAKDYVRNLEICFDSAMNMGLQLLTLPEIKNKSVRILTSTKKYYHIWPIWKDLHRLIVKERREFCWLTSV